ncbi:hypothetical protein LX15_003110 [Streptoalloteichus tenebrarius]|uniref:Uncharacterized protein n=1 Tax=Streptoalloteichus tenebrarius (strain ATCC 17920 / DSM 40477 / JCM 4838 / CBS 697.72 / NBRC 16177 / NCIMB 11028 / NRRL B-12390 / A12253. 1 / ISP 5477) TaxID=1933 RepID=A0ABT1HV68_STRSD|nr:hypothetical protein [Streptoalloteichus tenebrarius]MCP2259409.1 hypothetical protein [Streptoalloteichus tenebrarius]BFF02351.1 hypothetical protein GCM10020241_40260 [Streptoalloteichus tenebrarius]
MLGPAPLDPAFQQPAPTDDPEELADDGNRLVGVTDRDELDPAELADDGNRVVPGVEPDLDDLDG